MLASFFATLVAGFPAVLVMTEKLSDGQKLTKKLITNSFIYLF